MIIRSQDKKIVTKFHAISIVHKYSNHRFKEMPTVIGYQLVAFLGTETDLIVAEYSTEEKAIKVLDMIQEEYGKHLYGQGGQMATANYYVPPFAFVPPKVFQMPSDESVEV